MHVCTSLQTDNHTSTPPLSFFTDRMPSCRPTNSIKALKAKTHTYTLYPCNYFQFFCLISLLLWSYSALGRVARRKPMWVTKMGSHIPAVCCPGDRIKVLYGLHTRNGKTTDTPRHIGCPTKMRWSLKLFICADRMHREQCRK